ncbi:hypothetical protein NA56DRAFT_577694, partial [Hyaloscypha hepaticicola]
MSFGGFGLSPGDFVLLVQLARRTLRNCQQAGDEYAEIASEVRCLYSVLRSVRKLAQGPDSTILRRDQEVKGEFERMRHEIKNMATRARALDKNGSSLSLLSLSTYAGDEKEVWRAFRRELITKGFRSQSLDKYGHILQAYMLKLDQ